MLQRIVSCRTTWLGEVATAFYIIIIALIAQLTGLSFVLFPELGALSHDILKRPHGTWAKAPLMLVVNPALQVGNVRELQHALERAFILAGNDATLDVEHFQSFGENSQLREI